MSCLTSMCRSCRYYQPQGRRGGQCEVLGVSVQSNWKACHFAVPPFTVYWEESQQIGIENLYQELESESCQGSDSGFSQVIGKSISTLLTV